MHTTSKQTDDTAGQFCSEPSQSGLFVSLLATSVKTRRRRRCQVRQWTRHKTKHFRDKQRQIATRILFINSARNSSSSIINTKRPQSVDKAKHVNEKIVISMLLFLIVCAILSNIPGQVSTMATGVTDYDGATFYKAPVGSRIRIACNASRWQDDSVSLVLWFKGSPSASASSSSQQPIYTLDARQRPLSSGGARHLVADSLRGRAKFVMPQQQQQQHNNHHHHYQHQTAGSRQQSSTATNESDAAQQQQQQPMAPYLEVSSLEPEDQGEYRCRVDYRSRPRENFLIVLFVLVPPSRVEIMDSSGRSLEQIYGPLSEGSDLTLLCLAKGGRPPPAVYWLQSHQGQQSIIDDTYLTLNDYVALRGADKNSSSLSWPAQNDETSGNDKNQRQTINFLPANKQNWHHASADALVAEWRSWPEYELFNSQLNDQQRAQSTKSKASNINNNKNAGLLGTGSGKKAATGQQQQPSPQMQLLDLQADETITTSVNVLHLSELSRDHLVAHSSDTGSVLSQSGAASASAGAHQALVGLECRASNVHYDLRSLIRLFAPASLLDAARLPSAPESSASTATVTKAQAPLLSLGTDTASRQLVEAIERSLAANLRPPLGASDEQQWSVQVSERDQTTSGGAQPLRQIKMESDGRATGATDHSLKQQQQQPRRPTTPTPSWPTVIYQQLVRPHQLSEQAATATNNDQAQTAESRQEQTVKQQEQQQQQTGLTRSKLIALDAYLRPLDVKIIGSQRPLAAGQVHEFTCVTSGSRPAAKIVWLKNGRPLSPVTNSNANGQATTDETSSMATISVSSIQMSADGEQQQRSKLALKLERADNQAQLSCRATNDKALALIQANTGTTITAPAEDKQQLSSWQLEDTITLGVQYAPSARLELGNKMLSERLREGSDIFFECHVDARPQVREVTWLHNEKLINETSWWRTTETANSEQHQHQQQQPAQQARLIVSNSTLVLQRVAPEQAGQYACMASNSEGIGLSNRIELRVLHAPICVAGRVTPVVSGVHDGDGGYQMGTPRANNENSANSGAARVQKKEATTTSDNNDNNKKQHRHHAHAVNNGQAAVKQRTNELTLPLKLATRRTAIGAHLDFRCEWLAEPAERMQFTWYLNNSASERRILSVSSLSPASSESDDGKKSDPTNKIVSSQLSYRLESAADFGQIFCLAENELGEQKRACAQTIELDEHQESSSNSITACLPLNVTSESAWIGCEFGHQTEQQINNNNKRYQFDVLVYRYGGDMMSDTEAPMDAAVTKYGPSNARNLLLNKHEIGDINNAESQLLEANLSSSILDEPLFALVNLKPMTNYAIEIYPLDLLTGSRRTQVPAVVKLDTRSGPMQEQQPSMAHSSADLRSTASSTSAPSISRVTEPHRSDLLEAALISTRSTNGRALVGDPSRSLLRQQAADSNVNGNGGWWDALVSSILGTSDESASGYAGFTGRSHTSKLPAAAAGGSHQNKQQSAYKQFFHHLDNTTFGTIVCLVVLLTTLSVVLLLHRFTNSGTRPRQRRRSSTLSSKQSHRQRKDWHAKVEPTNGAQGHHLDGLGTRSDSSLAPGDSCCLDEEDGGGGGADNNHDDSGDEDFEPSSNHASRGLASEKVHYVKQAPERGGAESTSTVDTLMFGGGGGGGTGGQQQSLGASGGPEQSAAAAAELAMSQQHVQLNGERSSSALLFTATAAASSSSELGHHRHSGTDQGPLIYSADCSGAGGQPNSCALNSLSCSSSGTLTTNPSLLSSSRANGCSAFGTMRLVHMQQQQQQRHATNHNDQLPALLYVPSRDDGHAVAPRPMHSLHHQQQHHHHHRRHQQGQTSARVTRSRSSVCFDSAASSWLQLAPALGLTEANAPPPSPRLTHLSGGSGGSELHVHEAKTDEQLQQQQQRRRRRLISDANFIPALREQSAGSGGGPGDSLHVASQLNDERQATAPNDNWQLQLGPANVACQCSSLLAQQRQSSMSHNNAQHANEHLCTGGAYPNNNRSANLYSLMSSTATATIISTDESNGGGGSGQHMNDSENCIEPIDIMKLVPVVTADGQHDFSLDISPPPYGHKVILADGNQLISGYETNSSSCQEQNQQHHNHLVRPLEIDSSQMIDQIVSSSSPALTLSSPQQIGCNSLTPFEEGSDPLLRSNNNEHNRRTKQLTSILKNSSTRTLGNTNSNHKNKHRATNNKMTSKKTNDGTKCPEASSLQDSASTNL